MTPVVYSAAVKDDLEVSKRVSYSLSKRLGTKLEGTMTSDASKRCEIFQFFSGIIVRAVMYIIGSISL